MVWSLMTCPRRSDGRTWYPHNAFVYFVKNARNANVYPQVPSLCYGRFSDRRYELVCEREPAKTISTLTGRHIMKTVHVAEYRRGVHRTATCMGVIVDCDGGFDFRFLFRRRGNLLYFVNKTREISVGRCAVAILWSSGVALRGCVTCLLR
jgi:hypothetical protein